ncbi:uncharacterized protein LOC119725585 [Patiria miniata]|uniref:Sushi domain-containing protein n=1 Tax=Patiria miniata TaxID=46514 RepID=A0A913ZMJ9_PATMI|nr:uncharacterized protein LOC119725585 [Patiria miniata]
MAARNAVLAMLFVLVESQHINHPGYKGCYWDEAQMMNSAFGRYAVKDDTMTVELCLQICKDRNASLAGLRQHDQCHCGDNIRESRNCQCMQKCGFTCSGNGDQFCGGSYWKPAKTRMSVYDVSSSECPHPGQPTHGLVDAGDFWFGSEVTFRCDVGFQIHGNRSAQCILDESGNVTWSYQTSPACLALTSAAPPAGSSVGGEYEVSEVTKATAVAAPGSGDYGNSGPTKDEVVAMSVGLSVLAVAVLVGALCGVYVFKWRRVHDKSRMDHTAAGQIKPVGGARGSDATRSVQSYVNTTYDMMQIASVDASPYENVQQPLTPEREEVTLSTGVVDEPTPGNEVDGCHVGDARALDDVKTGDGGQEENGYQLPAEKSTNPDEGWVENIIYESADK